MYCRFIAYRSSMNGSSAVIFYQLLLVLSSSLISTVVSHPSCKPINREYELCGALDGRGSTHFFPQYLPKINNDIEGFNINIGFVVFDSFEPPPPCECIEAARHIACIVAATPCHPQTGQPLLICNESCEAYNKLLDVEFCRGLNDNIHAIKSASTYPDLIALVDIYFEFVCDNASTYLFDPSITDYSSESCTQIYEADTLDVILSRPSCLSVPSGPCLSLSETGYYITSVPDRDATDVTKIIGSFGPNDTSLQTTCQTSLLKLACDYYYPPCDPRTFQQRDICKESCKSLSLIQSACRSEVGNASLLNDILHLDCDNPMSYLVENVSVSENQCINLTTYAIDLTVTSNLDQEAVIIGVLVGCLSLVVAVVCTLVIIASACWLRKGRQKSSHISARYSSKVPAVDLQYVITTKDSDNISVPKESDDFLKLLELEKESYVNQFSSVLIPNANILKAEGIGEGTFGKVYKGELVVACVGSDSTRPAGTVAIKTIKHLTSQEQLKAFFSESLIMKDFDHPNVLGLTGVCFDTPDGYPFLILPFMVNGSLKDYLKKSRRHVTDVDSYPEGLDLATLVRMCMDIVRGMEYLAEKKFVHRDLAARNCMVDDNLRIKVGDFGLARDVYSSDYYRANRNAKLPVKWMPPETLHDSISNEKTDVWSFGVTCWETFSLGRAPYPGISNYEVVSVISSGVRLEKPNLCPSTLYSLILPCWELLPGDRPTFAELNSQLSDYWEEHFAYS